MDVSMLYYWYKINTINAIDYFLFNKKILVILLIYTYKNIFKKFNYK